MLLLTRHGVASDRCTCGVACILHLNVHNDHACLCMAHMLPIMPPVLSCLLCDCTFWCVVRSACCATGGTWCITVTLGAVLQVWTMTMYRSVWHRKNLSSGGCQKQHHHRLPADCLGHPPAGIWPCMRVLKMAFRIHTTTNYACHYLLMGQHLVSAPHTILWRWVACLLCQVTSLGKAS